MYSNNASMDRIGVCAMYAKWRTHAPQGLLRHQHSGPRAAPT